MTLSTQVRGSSVCVPVPLECQTLYVPTGNTRVSTVLPSWSTPAPVNTPVSMALRVLDVADVVMSWVLEMPATTVRAAGEALAGTASHNVVAVTAGMAIAAARAAFRLAIPRIREMRRNAV